MGKPLLTDDIIEQAKRGEIDLEEHPYYEDYDQEFYDEDYEADYQPSAYKSRRIENAKRNQFQHKLNRILFWVVVLLILLFIDGHIIRERNIVVDYLASRVLAISIWKFHFHIRILNSDFSSCLCHLDIRWNRAT